MSATTKQRLIEAAFELFARHGFHAIGLDRLLADVGVTKTTFYNHFQSKDDLVIEVIKHRDHWEFNLLKERLRKHGGPRPADQLRCVFEVLDEWFTDPEFQGCIFITAAAEFPSPNDPAHQAAAVHLATVRDHLRDLAYAADAEDPVELAHQLLLLMEGAIIMRHITGDPNAAYLARATAEPLLAKHLPAAPERMV